jgi:hypothetical protein
MKNFAGSLISIIIFSSTSFASENRSHDLRESPTYCGKFTENVENRCGDAYWQTNAAATNEQINGDRKQNRGLTNYERMMIISGEN